MHYSNVKLIDLKTYEDCDKAMESIENDYQNIQGGFQAWNSGYESDLLIGAEKKIKAIQARQERIYLKGIKESYKEFKKKNPEISWETYYEEELYC